MLNAIRKRHTYGATDNIILDVRMGEHFMGDEFPLTRRAADEDQGPRAPAVARVDIIKDNKVIYTTQPEQADGGVRVHRQGLAPRDALSITFGCSRTTRCWPGRARCSSTISKEFPSEPVDLTLRLSAATATATIARLSADTNDDALGFKLGVASYSFRSFPRAEAIKMMQELKIRFASIKEVHLRYTDPPEELEKGRKEFEAAGIKIMSGGNISLAKNDDADIRKYFQYAKNCGMPMIVCAPTHENLKKLEAAVKEFNIRAAIHNHGPEDKHFPTPESVLEAVKDLDPRVGLCMDIGHSVRAGSDVVKMVSVAGKRLLDMHVKDLKDAKAKDSQCDVGDGMMPFPELFRALRKNNYKGCVNLEYEIHAKDPLPGMKRSYAYMRKVIAEIKG